MIIVLFFILASNTYKRITSFNKNRYSTHLVIEMKFSNRNDLS